MIGGFAAFDRAIRNAFLLSIAGRTGTVTLTPSVAATTLTNPIIRRDSAITLTPTTANAAAEVGNGTIYIGESGRLNGSAVITHANNAQTDRIYRYFIG